MATSKSMASISTRIYKTLLSKTKPSASYTFNYLSKSLFSSGPEFDFQLPVINSDSEQPAESPVDNSAELGSDSAAASSTSDEFGGPRGRGFSDTLLDGGLDIGIYKAVIVGQVGQSPMQKRLKNSRTITLTSVGTGGIRNERIPFPNEEPREYADRCNVQWHRVAIYPERLGEIVMKHAQPGVLVYLEGNLETKIFTDQVTGLVRRVREIAVRRNGRVVFLGNGSDFNQPSPNELRGIGYF